MSSYLCFRLSYHMTQSIPAPYKYTPVHTNSCKSVTVPICTSLCQSNWNEYGLCYRSQSPTHLSTGTEYRQRLYLLELTWCQIKFQTMPMKHSIESSKCTRVFSLFNVSEVIPKANVPCINHKRRDDWNDETSFQLHIPHNIFSLVKIIINSLIPTTLPLV
eukprot:TRINITY_DN17016_c0_g1_i1.p1 TRINITY_DN17016_c0_g1~~TRINITY_DN17016_c0_g1_i1.p1  ORF type:complete len:161 (-),score=0.18 TRINITY_DN17016_c0_g1_i1:104-586(-)